MAIDRALMEHAAEGPILRLYRWEPNWGSYGYFQTETEARAAFKNLTWVRRWTGGGVVDHRADRTYTLAIPPWHPVAKLRQDGSYQAIHEGVAEALLAMEIQTNFSETCQPGASAACFEAPVRWDLTGPNGNKLAGAGQRRGRLGFLHQGSVAVTDDRFFDLLPEILAEKCDPADFSKEFADGNSTPDK